MGYIMESRSYPLWLGSERDTSSGRARPRCGAQRGNGSASLNSQRFLPAIRTASAIRSPSNCFSRVCLSIESQSFSDTVASASRNAITRRGRDLAKSRSKPTSGPLGATIRSLKRYTRGTRRGPPPELASFQGEGLVGAVGIEIASHHS
jgi:hypothetical protein